MESAETVEMYIQQYPEPVRGILKQVRATIQAAAPQAEEKLSYGIPTFTLKGNLVHFGGYAKHVGFYPGPEAIVAFKEELTPYKTSKGAIQFSVEKPVPYELITKMTLYRVDKNLNKKK
ncbi:DUF1801 domain-containing protein [Candidatus Woesebacteria bacterium]|nr:DUF1801 domain-containing protein [Candidatus Woesebacteria bacterium]